MLSGPDTKGHLKSGDITGGFDLTMKDCFLFGVCHFVLFCFAVVAGEGWD